MAGMKRVMIVEDDLSIAQMLAKTLGTKYKVSVVNDGSHALATAVDQRPDLVLLDVNLPGMDGYTVAAAMRDSNVLSRVPIIFLTARDSSLDVIKGIQVGAKHYITKPFQINDVIGKVQKLLPA